MHVTMFTIGSRGDIQPFIILKEALESAGHTTMLCVFNASISLPERHKKSINQIPIEPEDNTLSSENQRQYKAPPKLRLPKLARLAIRRYDPMMAHLLQQMARFSTTDTHIIVYHTLLPGNNIAEWLGVPGVPIALRPFAPTHAFPPPSIETRLPRFLNRASYAYPHVARHALFGSTVTDGRQHTLGLPRRRGQHNLLRQSDGSPTIVLQAFSRRILPSDTKYSDSVSCTGYWFPPETTNWKAPHELSEFLRAGEPPIYIGFGSNVGENPQKTKEAVLTAIDITETRAIISGGSGKLLSDMPSENTFYANDIPFEWLFPRIAAIVHHGGSGTCGAALAAGRPQVICPEHSEQPFNARRMHEIGVATARLPQKALNSIRLANAIRLATTSRKLARSAEELGACIRAEPGVKAAVRILESSAL